jgi:hypothetical protein
MVKKNIAAKNRLPAALSHAVKVDYTIVKKVKGA